MSAVRDRVPSPAAGPTEDLFESKLHPPPLRAALVSRATLIDRLDAAADVPITAVVAPPGYGKTTLLAEWSQRHPTRFAWLSIDQHDNDLARLVSYTAAALDRIEPVDFALPRRASSRRSVALIASRVASAMSEMKEPVILVLDNVESLHDVECLDTIAELALHLPPNSRLVIASRTEPPLPIARLRAGGNLVEVGADDLAMTATEARALLAAAKVELDDDEMDAVLERTEGWPVGLYLAALSLKAGGPREGAGVPFSGDDRLMAEYLRTEMLSLLSEDEVTFLTRTAVLDRLSGPLCDAVLDSTGSGALLQSLAHSNLLLVALDRRGEWYRYHHLFRDLLRAEGQRREPALVASLHVRAAAWYEANRMPELAIDHAQAGGDAQRVNRLVLANAQPVYALGRAETVRRWIEWFEEEDLASQYPAVAVTASVFYTATGEPAAAERWALAAEHASPVLRPDGSPDADRGSPERVLSDGSTLASWRAFLRALQSRNGPDAMRRDAEYALEGLSATSGYRCAALVLLGLSKRFEGDSDAADAIFAHAVDVGLGTPAGPALAIAIAERGFCALARRDWRAVETFTQDGLATVQQMGLDDYTESALLFTLAARMAIQNGDLATAREYLTRTARLRPLLTYARPPVSARALIELAHAYVAIDDAAGAREILRQTRDILQKRSNLGVLPAEIDELEAKLETMRTGNVGASSLTAAELRLVPFLPTHLSYPQIGARLQISRNTAKSQAISIYQKLEVSSRSDAVERLQAIGLLDA